VANPLVGSAKPGARLLALDGVRGLAIALVMGVHFLGDATAQSRLERGLLWLGNQGIVGVDLFFVLSGFLITGILYDARQSSSYYGDFYMRRLLRIFPLYYGVLAALFVVWPLFRPLPAGLREAAMHQGWLWLYGTNIYETMKGSWAFPYLSHFWSLAIEEHFYFLWPLAVRLCSRRALLRLCLCAILFSFALRAVLGIAGATPMAAYVLTPCRLDALCAGAMLALLARGPAGMPALARHAREVLAASGVGLAAVIAWHIATPRLEWLSLSLRTSFFAFAFAALIAMVLTSNRGPVQRSFENPLLRFFGKYSYGLYVFHGILSYGLTDLNLQQRVTAAVGSHLAGFLLQALLGTAASLAVAVVSYELFEKRFLGLKRYFEGSGKRKPVRVPAVDA
jgi:peptidoglycan/LPS O-acetylase OafA/YrhL